MKLPIHRVDYYLRAGWAKWDFWYRGLIGFGRVPDINSSGVATNHAFGASIHFNRFIGVGVMLEGNYITVDQTLYTDLGRFSLDIGLIVHGKFPI